MSGTENPIGMFDSGVGGLSVLREIMLQMPEEDVIYFADTARLPFGGKTPEEIVAYNYEIIDFLVSSGVKMIIMACGTSSAIAYPIVKHRYSVPIIPLIESGSMAAVAATENKKIGVIATQATIDSTAYHRAIKKIKKDVEVFEVACPLFVPLIEGGFAEADETKKTAAQYLKSLLKAEIDTLILGCTHYPHLIKILREIIGIKIKLIDPAEKSAAEAKKLLLSKGLACLKAPSAAKHRYKYYVSGSPAQFQEIGSRLLGKPISNVEQVVLPKAKVRPVRKK